MKKILLILALLAGFSNQVSAQKEVLTQNPALDSIPRKFGPNLRYYTHFLVGFGLVAGPAEADGSKVRYGGSHEWLIGIRFKYKLAEPLAVGLEANLNPQTYYLKQKTGKTLPTSDLHEMEKFKFTNLGLGAYLRINYDKRGNYMGNFIDLGAYGNFMPYSAHIYSDEIKYPVIGAKNLKVRETGLKYVSDFNYGFTARAGFNRYVFYTSYRISDFFDTGYTASDDLGGKTFDFAELPRLRVGFQLSMHK